MPLKTWEAEAADRMAVVVRERNEAQAARDELLDALEHWASMFWDDDAPHPKPDEEYELAIVGRHFIKAKRVFKKYKPPGRELHIRALASMQGTRIEKGTRVFVYSPRGIPAGEFVEWMQTTLLCRFAPDADPTSAIEVLLRDHPGLKPLPITCGPTWCNECGNDAKDCTCPDPRR